MLRIRALCARILTQFGRDRRTLALLFVAPVLVLWLLTVILNGTAASVHVATVDLPEALQTQLSKTDAHIERADASQAKDLIDADDVAAVLSMDGDTLRVELEGTDTGKSQQVMAAVNEAMAALRKEHQSEVEAAQREAEAAMQRKAEQLQSIMANPHPKTQQRMASAVDELMQAADPEMEALAVTGVDTVYLHGGEDWKIFDFYGPVFIGIFLFVFTFITSGMSLVTERTGGTMTRFLTTPISGAQILSGYTAAFGVLSFVQSFIILGISIRFIGFPCVGNMWFLVLTCMLLAMTSVSLGLLVSALARTPFQVVQMMLLFVVPQILLCGLFDLSGAPMWLQAIGKCCPVTYGVEVLRDVMLRGQGWEAIWIDLLALFGFLAVFFVLGALGFRKKCARVRR